MFSYPAKGQLCPNPGAFFDCAITHKKITELIPKQFRFGSSSTEITEHDSPKLFCKGFGDPLLTLLTGTN